MTKERLTLLLALDKRDPSKSLDKLQVYQEMQRLLEETNNAIQTTMLQEVLHDWMGTEATASEKVQ